MPNPTPLQLGTLLKNHLRKHGLKVKYVAPEMELSPQTLGNFVNAKHSPQQENLEAIIEWMKNAGILSPLGLPIEPGPVVADDVDRRALELMGIQRLELKSSPYYTASAVFSPRTFFTLMGAVMQFPEEAREECLQKLLPHEFPAKA